MSQAYDPGSFDAFEAAAWTRMVVRGHDADTVRRIREGVERRVDAFREGGGLALPVSAKLGTGRRPA
jgi:hypothetical protein